MNISEPFIKRPVMTTLVMIGILLFGIQAYRLLPVSDLPNVDFPTLVVGASLPGASPETMASAVATPLERQFTTIAGLDSMTSANQLGSTVITLQFSLERNIDAAAQDVQAAIAQASRQLPPEMPTPPSYQKVNPADQPVLYLALTFSPAQGRPSASTTRPESAPSGSRRMVSGSFSSPRNRASLASFFSGWTKNRARGSPGRTPPTVKEAAFIFGMSWKKSWAIGGRPAVRAPSSGCPSPLRSRRSSTATSWARSAPRRPFRWP